MAINRAGIHGKIEVLVIGAGVVGLAIARAAAREGKAVIVAEREAIAGSIISARNSGVVHAGIYYPKGSKKACFCVEGKTKLYAYVKERNVPINNGTKIIVACEDADIAKLSQIQQKAADNGVNDLRMLSKSEIE